MGSRLTDFMAEYKLEGQGIMEQLNTTESIPQIDYRESDKIWSRRRTESYQIVASSKKAMRV